MPKQFLVVDLGELRTLRVECRRCSAVTVINLGAEFQSVPQECGCDWNASASPGQLDLATELLKALTVWHRSLAVAPFRLQFEVRD